MASEPQLFCLVLDGPGDIDNHIAGIRIARDWTLGDLQNALERHYPPYKGVSLGSIKVWALDTYLDEPSLSELDPATATTYNGVPLINIEERKCITSYFPKPFESNEAKKIHLVAKLHGQFSCSNGIVVPDYMLDYHCQFWGVPLDLMLTTLPNDASAMGLDDASQSSNEEYSKGDVLPGEPFLDVGETRLLVRAEYIRVFDAVEDIHKEAHNTRSLVLTGQPGNGKTCWILYALRRCLGEKQKVVWYKFGRCFFFSESGVNIVDPTLYKSGGKHTWCFVDSVSAPDILPDSICDVDIQLFPIYVTSNKTEWINFQRSPNVVVMNPWKWQEIEKASQLYPKRDLADVRARFDVAGPNAHICFDYDSRDIQDFYREREGWIGGLTTADSFVELVYGAKPLSMDDIHRNICIVHRYDFNDVRGPHIIDPVTSTIRQQLLIQFWNLEREEASDLMRRFSQSPFTCGMASVLFEAYLHRVFGKRIELIAKPMFRTGDSRSHWHAVFNDFSRDPVLQVACSDALRNMSSGIALSMEPTKVIVYSNVKELDTKLAIEEDAYHIPTVGNETGFDALIVHKGYLYLLKFTSRSMHGLEDLSRQFSGLPPRRNWRFIFIAPESLVSFASPHNHGFFGDHIPYAAQVAVAKRTYNPFD